MNLPDVIRTGDKMGLNIALREYKSNKGVIMFDKVLSIPREQRLPQMAENNFPDTIMVVTAALTLAFESMNLKRGMSANQTIDLAEQIVDSANEDWLALEDLMLFLQGLVRGEYGSNYESMDIPKFMEKFDIFRDTRHKAYTQIKEEQHCQYKVMGDTGRSNVANPLEEHFAKMGETMSNLKSKIADQKEQINSLKMDKL